ncbi:hypothetical protein D1007_32051 [Hordeum vulgare]|nr:hypothetical protein D1007_32051 [Hordeum vulgare]
MGRGLGVTSVPLVLRWQTWAAMAYLGVVDRGSRMEREARGVVAIGLGRMFSFTAAARRPPMAAPAPRQRSCSPQARRRSKETAGRRQGAGRVPTTAWPQPQQRRARPPPSPPSDRRANSEALVSRDGSVADEGHKGKDPVDGFFKTASKPAIASTTVDSMAADVHAAAEAVLDAFSPTLSAAASDLGQYNRATPTSARTMELQLGAVTGRVSQLEIGAAVDRPETRNLFRASKQPLITAALARRPVAPPKNMASSTPTRHNAGQAANVSMVPVAQRASLHLVKELGLLGPRDKMTDEVAGALLQRFDEPLSDSDLAVIARLTRLDSEALRVMASMIGPDGVAEEARV